MNFTQMMGTGCIARYNTANLNNYLFATNGGTGPSYSNMCVGVTEPTGDGSTDGGDDGDAKGTGSLLYNSSWLWGQWAQ